MASSSPLDILKGIGAAAAGLAGEKVAKSGSIPGLDIASIIPALLGGKSGGSSNLLGTIASVASKSGLLKDTKLGNIADLAGSLLSIGKSSSKTTAKTSTKADGIAGLAASILGSTGTGANLASIAASALKLGKTAENDKSLVGMASELGKTLSGKFGVSLAGSGTAVNALDKVIGNDLKATLFTSILKGIAK